MESPVIKSVSFNPIAPWPVLILAALGVLALTLWAYRMRFQGTAGRWRWLAVVLRVIAVVLCLMAAARPSVVLLRKVKQTATMIFLLDRSSSMLLTDEVQGQSRWDVALKGLALARDAAKKVGPGLEARFYAFDSSLRDWKPGDKAPPDGKQTAMGNALLESLKRESGSGRVAGIVLFTDGASNAGLAPLTAAQQLRSQQVPIRPVGVGSETAGAASRDIAARELVAGPIVFVKNKLQVRGTLNVRGYANQPLDVELLAEGHKEPVAHATVRAAEGQEVVPIRGLEYIPDVAGETMLTLRVKPKEGELVRTNNEISTFVTVLKGGLNVLYLQGPNFSWEYKFLHRAIDPSPDIRTDLKVIRRPPEGDDNSLDADFTPGRYDVYVLGDLPADYLTPVQQRLLVRAVERGAGLVMLGGRSSFGAGGWARTEVASILPTSIHPGDGQMDPEGGIKTQPIPTSLDSYILKLGATRADSERVWNALPPIPGANRLGPPKAAAVVLAQGPDREPLMVDQEVGKGRVLAFGGETWVWARFSDESQLAHRKFWRQAIFWLAHKEDQGETQVKVSLDRRRVAVGEKLELTVTARDAKNEPITDATFKTVVTRLAPNGKEEPVELYNQGDEARGTYFATGEPGEYRVSVTGFRNAREIGRDSARFLVYQDDRELENPAADHALLRQLAELTAGKFLTPEQLGKYLGSLSSKDFTDYVSQSERKIWDNWPFFLIFVAVLSLEWWLRKRNGWV